MGYDDRFYYGRGNILVKAGAEYEGMTVSLHSSNDRYYTNTIENGQAKFSVPGTDYYDISLIGEGTESNAGTVSVSYGEAKTIELKGEVQWHTMMDITTD